MRYGLLRVEKYAELLPALFDCVCSFHAERPLNAQLRGISAVLQWSSRCYDLVRKVGSFWLNQLDRTTWYADIFQLVSGFAVGAVEAPPVVFVTGSDLPASQHGATFNVFADERNSSLRSCLPEILARPSTANHRHCCRQVESLFRTPRLLYQGFQQAPNRRAAQARCLAQLLARRRAVLHGVKRLEHLEAARIPEALKGRLLRFERAVMRQPWINRGQPVRDSAPLTAPPPAGRRVRFRRARSCHRHVHSTALQPPSQSN